MITEALFHDETGLCRSPEEPRAGEPVTLFFRTAKDDVSAVYLVSRDHEMRLCRDKDRRDARFDWYRITLTVPEKLFSYYFEVESGMDMVAYDRTGSVRRPDPQHQFRIQPGLSVPDWACGALMYQIFTDRFKSGDGDNDVQSGEYVYLKHRTEQVAWDSEVQGFDVARFYGGDLPGVRSKLDYLQSLGVEVLYFNPLFVSPSNHKYDTQDYDHIDPHLTRVPLLSETNPAPEQGNEGAERYGRITTDAHILEASDAWFADFCAEVHARGMKIILDGVFNHCGSFNKWLDREKIYEKGGGVPGAYARKDSPYHGYFRFEKDAWPDNPSYEGWWNNDTLPKLNIDGCPELADEIIRIGKKWVSPPYCADGWRLDVAADLGHTRSANHAFWKRFREAVREANPQALVLAEHYGNPAAWILRGEWDSVMNYDAFMEPVTWFLTGMEKHSDFRNDGLYGNGEVFFHMMANAMSKLTGRSLYCAMNQLSNHDHSRFLTRTNRTVGRLATSGSAAASQGINKGVFREACVMLMTWPGAPTLYYGDEAGLCGFTDPDCRRPYPWGHEDLELIEFHKYLASFRRKCSCMRKGSVKGLAAGYQLVAYGRFDADTQAVVVIHNGTDWKHVKLPVWTLGVPDGQTLERVLTSNEAGYNVGCKSMTVKDGYLEADIGPVSAVLYLRKESGE